MDPCLQPSIDCITHVNGWSCVRCHLALGLMHAAYYGNVKYSPNEAACVDFNQYNHNPITDKTNIHFQPAYSMQTHFMHDQTCYANSSK